jgi:multidrug efflux pump subunit AcrA (membrane-fusion protein)
MAVQSIGNHRSSTSADDETRFVEREVKVGASSGALVEVVQGIKPGERVVTEDSFFSGPRPPRRARVGSSKLLTWPLGPRGTL